MELAALVVALVALVLASIVALAMLEVVARLKATEPMEQDEITSASLLPGIEGSDVSTYGLTTPSSGAHIVLVLSPTCGMCQRLVDSLREKGVPQEVSFILTAATRPRLDEWLATIGLPAERTYLDPDRSLVDRLGIGGSPSALPLVDRKILQLLNIGGVSSFWELVKQTQEFSPSGLGWSATNAENRPD